MRSKVRRRHVRGRNQCAAACLGWSLASRLGSALRDGYAAVCGLVTKTTDTTCGALQISPHALAAGILHGSGVVVDFWAVPGLSPLWNFGVGTATAGLAAHAVVTVAREYNLEEDLYVPVLTETVRRAHATSMPLPAGATMLELCCELARPDGAPEGPLADAFVQGTWSLIRKKGIRWAGEALPGIRSFVGWLDAGAATMRSVAYVNTIETEAQKVCLEMTVASTNSFPSRENTFHHTDPWSDALAA